MGFDPKDLLSNIDPSAIADIASQAAGAVDPETIAKMASEKGIPVSADDVTNALDMLKGASDK